jgi:hypothetical protein
MVDADARDEPPFDQLQQQRVGIGKDARIFHAQAGEIVDVEKAPVIDLIERRPPVREAIGLHLEQTMQQIEAAAIACGAIELAHCPVDVFCNAW